MAVNIQPVPTLERKEETRRFLAKMRADLISSYVVKETFTGTGTIGSGNTIICNSPTAFTLTMPVITDGRRLTIKNIGAGTVTLDGSGTETVGGDLTFPLYEREDLEVIGDGTDWI